MMNMSYKWAMPNKETFSIKPIGQFIKTKGITIDPFSNRKHKYANITNDIDKNKDVDCHMCALDFLKTFESESVECVLFDPPYSLRQLKEVYSGLGKSLSYEHTTTFFRDVKNEISRITKKGGYVYSFGWSSVGMGSNRSFKKTDILVVCHGGYHHDTIVLKEVKL